MIDKIVLYKGNILAKEILVNDQYVKIYQNQAQSTEMDNSFSCCFNKLNGQLNLDSKLCWFGITM